MENRQTKWLNIQRVPRHKPGLKTELYAVCAKDGAFLGEIKWFGRWRRYSFFPAGETVFEPTCMRDIAQFMDDLMAERKSSG